MPTVQFPPKEITKVEEAKELVRGLSSFHGYVSVTELPELGRPPKLKQIIIQDEEANQLPAKGDSREMLKSQMIDFGGKIFSWLSGSEDIEVYPSGVYATLKCFFAQRKGGSSYKQFLSSYSKRFKSIFKKKFICLPVNEGAHWRLLVLVHPGSFLEKGEGDSMCCLVAMDSSGNSKGKVDSKASMIYEWLNMEWNEQYPNKDQSPFNATSMHTYCPGVPQQKRGNGNACGPFTILAIRFVMCQVRQMSYEQLTGWIKSGRNSEYGKSYGQGDADQLREDMYTLFNKIKTTEEPVAIEEPATEEDRKPAAKEKSTMKEPAAEEESNMEEPASEDAQAEEPATAEAHPRKQAQKKRNGSKRKASQKEGIAKASDGSSKRSSQQPRQRSQKGRSGPKRNAASTDQKEDMVGASGGSPKRNMRQEKRKKAKQVREELNEHGNEEGDPISLLSP